MTKNYLWKEGETPKEYAERLQKDVEDFKKQVIDMKTTEELEKAEKECIEALDKYDEYLKTTEYDLAESVDYDGTHYTRKEIAGAIMYFLNKLEIKWDYTLGLYQLGKMWRNNIEKITFRELDSTLRTLDQVQFKGYKEWKEILAVNEFFKSNNDQFSIDTAGLIYLSQRHNVVLDQKKLVETIENHGADKPAAE